VNERIAQRAVVQTPVAIVGIGCTFPGAKDLGQFWANVRDGVDAIRDVPATHWNVEDYYDPDPAAPDRTYGRRGGFLAPVDFEPMAAGIAPHDLEATDTTQLLALHVATRALEDAGYGSAGRPVPAERASVVLGVTGTLPLVIPLGARLGRPIWRRALAQAGVDPATADDVVERIADAYVPWQESSFPGLLGNVVAGRIANRLDLHGTNCVVDAACASSLSAIHLAVLELESGRSDLVLTGGVDTFNDPFMFMCFSKTPALSPTGDARPFAAGADGTILGEGVGMLVLKRLADAERDGDRIHAVIRGMGSSSDGKGRAVYAPDAAGQARALRTAYRIAGVRPDTIELVEAHGTGTRVGDATELAGLTEVYREARSTGTWCAVGSVKSMIGHTKAAAGAAGLIKAVMALRHGVLPPTIKVERPSDALDPDGPLYLNTRARPWLARPEHPRRAGVSAFGFGGSNFHCVLEEWRDDAGVPDWDGKVQLLAFSGADRSAVLESIDAFPRDAGWDDLCERAAALRERFAAGDPVRATLVVEHGGRPLGELLEVATGLLRGTQARGASPAGVFFGEGPTAGSLGMIFPGQGAQYPGMLRELACRFPAARDALGRADAETPGLFDRIVPPAAFDDAGRAAHAERLRATEAAQPALGAVGVAALAVLAHFAIAPAAAAGHSYGELLALFAAGRISEAELHRLSRLRGLLMARGEGDRGSMLAVQAPLERIEAMLREHDLDLVVANRNAPRQAVLSGVTREIERAERTLAAADVRVKRLDVAAAFHSSLVAQAGAPFAERLAEVELRPTDVIVFANAAGAPYPARAADARELLAAQLTSPVDFVGCVHGMAEAGVRTFLEVGPGRRLCGLVDEILAGREDVATVAIDASGGMRAGLVDLARVLAQLAARGHQVALARWEEGGPARRPAARPTGLTVPIGGANYVRPRPERPARAPLARIEPAPVAAPSPPPERVADALRASEDGLAALVRLQEQTAELHRAFLATQEAAVRSFEALVRGRHAAFGDPSDPIPLPQVPITSPAKAPPPRAAVPVPAAAPPGPDPDRIARVLTEIVAAKTGYPAEMLQPSMGLDADLGIDSIKRVEILAALQERLPETPTLRPEQLGELSTLAHIVEFLAASGPPPPPAPATAPGHEHVAAVLREVVAAKTGYPVEMLELSLGLDADLGVDSIKRVEILAALQERLADAPALTTDRLGELRTLGDIVDALVGGSPAPGRPAPAAPATERVQATLMAVIADKTGYPVEMLEPSMGLDADLGIDSIKRVEILAAVQERLPNAVAIEPARLSTLVTLEQVARALAGGDVPAAPVATAPPSASATASAGGTLRLVPVPRRRAEMGGPIRFAPEGRIWVTASGDGWSGALVAALRRAGRIADEVALDPALLVPDDLAGLVLVARDGGGDDAVMAGFSLVRRVAPALHRAARRSGAVLVALTRMGGDFGLSGWVEGADPAQAGLCGIVKTAAEEWGEVVCRCVDASTDADIDVLAREVASQGPREVGWRGSDAVEIVAEEHPIAAAAGPTFAADDVFVVTGGARGVTAEVAVALARVGLPRLILLGRSPAPATEPPWALGLEGEAELKRAIAERAGARATPRDVDAEWRRLASAREILRTIARVEAVGGAVEYLSVDVRDNSALRAAVGRLVARHGRITGVIHGAGVLADRRIEDKSDDDFRRVYETKVAGLRALLAEIGEAGPRVLVSFSSSTARYGRRGQADYAAANEVLNKLALQQAARHPAARVVAIGWGPWDGGMVGASLARVFADEGLRLIAPAIGAEHVLSELSCAAHERRPEVVVLAAGSTVPHGPEPAPSCAAPADAGLPVVFERQVSVPSHPVLASHVLDGRAVLPTVLVLEWLAHAALHGQPGLRFLGVDELRIFKGVILGPDEIRTVQVCAGAPVRERGEWRVAAELRSPGPGPLVLHARAVVVLSEQRPDPVAARALPALPPAGVEPAEIYARALFHGPALQGLSAFEGGDEAHFVARCRRAPAPAEWMTAPVRGRWIADPLALDCAMQAVIAWSFARFGDVSLPVRWERYRQWGAGGDELRIVVKVRRRDAHRVLADIEWMNARSELFARLDGYECVVDESLRAAFARRSLLDPPAVRV
jgi:acyl transferase domain-containing protein/acyl carrier protein